MTLMPRLKLVVPAIFAFAAMSVSLADARAEQAFLPEAGFVPNADTAARIAEAVWAPIYGREEIEDQKPFRVTLEGDVWKVRGKALPKGVVGGVAEADISKRDGRILRVIHGL